MMIRTLAAAVIIWGTTCGPGSPAARAADRPNILVILADDLCAGDLACRGGQQTETPHIDRIFREGMTFTHFRANSSVCSPTRAALLTGRYPDLVGVPGVIRTHPDQNFGELARDAVLLPRLLKPAGYMTALVGKWHLGLAPPNTPNDRGFDSFRGFLGDMMDDYETHLRHKINYMRENERVISPAGHATDLSSDWAVEYVRARGEDRRPFFLLLAYNAPHAPIQPPPAWMRRVRLRAPGLSEGQIARRALVEHMDAGIGRVLAAMGDSLLHETLVVFTSDNGGPVPYAAENAPFRDGKGSMYEGGLRVPFAARWPGRIPQGARSDFNAVTMDLFPTILAAADVQRPKEIDGVSLLPAFRGEAAAIDRPLFFMRRDSGRAFLGKSNDAVVQGDWKIVQNSPFGPLELFDLRSDPSERQDVIKTQKEIAAKLSRALERHVQRAGAVPWQRSSN